MSDANLYDIETALREADELSGSLDWTKGALLIEAKGLLGKAEYREWYEGLGMTSSQVSRMVTFAKYIPSGSGLTISKGYLAARAVKVLGFTVDDAVAKAKALSVSDFLTEVFGKERPIKHEHPCPECGKVHAITEP